MQEEIIPSCIKVKPVRLCNLTAGHMMRHEGQNKIIDGVNAGYINGVWAMRITFTDATQQVIAYPIGDTYVNVITSFY